MLGRVEEDGVNDRSAVERSGGGIGAFEEE